MGATSGSTPGQAVNDFVDQAYKKPIPVPRQAMPSGVPVMRATPGANPVGNIDELANDGSFFPSQPLPPGFGIASSHDLDERQKEAERQLVLRNQQRLKDSLKKITFFGQ